MILQQYIPYHSGEKIRIAFLFQAGTVWASMDSVYRSCLQDNEVEVTLVYIEETAVEKSHMIGAKEFLEKEHLQYVSWKKIDWNVYRPHVVFVQFPYDAACHTPDTLSIQFQRRGTRVVYIPYGIEISDTEIARKDHFQSFVVENSWRIYTCCEGIKKEYMKYCRNRQAVRVCGSPKFDAITRKNELPLYADIVKDKRGRKIVVWKMHFPKKISEKGKILQITPYLEEYIKFADSVHQYSDIYFVILAHPKMLKGVVASDVQGDENLMRQVQNLFEILQTKENVYIDTSEDYRHSLYHADAIILDRSAVMVEAAMTGVPILFMMNQDYQEALTNPIVKLEESFYQGNKFEDMQQFIEMVRNDQDERAQERKSIVDTYFPFTDGQCGLRIKESVIEGVREKQHMRPQVILYGTGEICKYYMEKQNWKESEQFDIVGIADSSSAKWGKNFWGTNIIAPEQILELDFDAIVIMTEPHYFDIKKKLVYDLYLDERKIWRIDEFVWSLEGQ